MSHTLELQNYINWNVAKRSLLESYSRIYKCTKNSLKINFSVPVNDHQSINIYSDRSQVTGQYKVKPASMTTISNLTKKYYFPKVILYSIYLWMPYILLFTYILTLGMIRLLTVYLTPSDSHNFFKNYPLVFWVTPHFPRWTWLTSGVKLIIR